MRGSLKRCYYPFGMVMPERKYQGPAYRFGFNGKENDNEVKGAGNELDYGMRIYDSRYGRFLSVDPLTKNYPWFSPYQFAANMPIKFIDLDGAETADPNKGVNSDAPDVDPKYRNVNLYRPSLGIVGPLKVLQVAFMATARAGGLITQIFGAAHYGDRVRKSEWAQQFPLLPTNNLVEDIIKPTLVAPAQIAYDLKKDPTSEEAWGEALAWGAPFIIGKFRSPLRAPLTLEASKAIDLSERSRVFTAGGSIGVLDGRGELNVDPVKMTLEGKFTSRKGYTVIFDANLELNGKTLDLTNVGIYLDDPQLFDNKAAANLVGRADFLNLQKEISDLVEAAGYTPGKIKYYRRPPEGSDKVQGDQVEIPLKR